MTKLFYAPGSCALGIHVLLEEVGKPFDLHKINLMEKEQYKPEYVAINPKAKVPALQRDDGAPRMGFVNDIEPAQRTAGWGQHRLGANL